ncbi:MAG: HAMP domain-containing histidine kinase [Magnetococcales bacterium]|nr:HAMP domain-containing histidine kinase [Magnetococcales bacterium]
MNPDDFPEPMGGDSDDGGWEAVSESNSEGLILLGEDPPELACEERSAEFRAPDTSTLLDPTPAAERKTRLSDDELILELKTRFDQTKQTLYDLQMMTRKLEEMNRKLEDSEKIKSNFVSHVKNEINNPITSILGLTQQLMSGARSSEMTMAIGTMIHAEAFSLDFQLRNIFAAAELEAGEAKPQVSRVDVGRLIKDAIDSFKHLIAEKNLLVSLSLGHEGADEAGRVIFRTDPEKLHLVFSNLLANAIEFNPTGGSIDIRASLYEGLLNLAVTDTGVGIDSSKIHLLFDRFRQMETGTTKRHKGHGLGLSISKAIVDMMEGSISVNSVPNQGCTFTVAVPEMELDGGADAFSVDGNEFFFGDDQIEAF